MIIGKALGNVLEGFTIDVNNKTVNVQNNYGKQDALDKFIAECDKKKVSKFPLIFYVTGKVKDLGIRLQCETNIVIMTNTNSSWLSKKRTSETFDKIIHPAYEALIKKIQFSDKLLLRGNRDTRLTYDDAANYGIVKGDIGQKKSSKSVVSDFIDARIVKLTIEYKK
jgi:dTDP-D-glucose 4,6-dehydratase